MRVKRVKPKNADVSKEEVNDISSEKILVNLQTDSGKGQNIIVNGLREKVASLQEANKQMNLDHSYQKEHTNHELAALQIDLEQLKKEYESKLSQQSTQLKDAEDKLLIKVQSGDNLNSANV